MATFFVLNHKKYRTSVRRADGSPEPIRFEPEVYFGGIGESTYTTSDPQIIEALHRHPAYEVSFWQKADSPSACTLTEPPTDNAPTDLQTLLPDPASATREPSVTSVAAARAWLQANLDYVVPAGMKKDDIRLEAARRNVLFVNW